MQIQHLQAQVELLEADSAGRHNADSTPGSPREPEADKLANHVESLQADNVRLQHQVHTFIMCIQHTVLLLLNIRTSCVVQHGAHSCSCQLNTSTDFRHLTEACSGHFLSELCLGINAHASTDCSGLHKHITTLCSGPCLHVLATKRN